MINLVKKEDDGMVFFEYPFDIPFNLRFLNAENKVMINDTLYQYAENKFYMYPKPENLKSLSIENAIVASCAGDEKTTLKSSTGIPYEHYNQLLTGEDKSGESTGSKKLKVRFRVRRYIYQNTNCTEDCIWSTTSFYLVYSTWLKKWWGWEEVTYQIDINGKWDFRYNWRGYAPPATTYITNIVSTGSNPYYFRQTWERNSDYPWYEFGNIDCFGINITDAESVEVGFALTYDPTDGDAPNYYGFPGMCRLNNTYN